MVCAKAFRSGTLFGKKGTRPERLLRSGGGAEISYRFENNNNPMKA